MKPNKNYRGARNPIRTDDLRITNARVGSEIANDGGGLRRTAGQLVNKFTEYPAQSGLVAKSVTTCGMREVG
jgi:hypothetical protein